ncbi:MAG: Fic family protein [Chitinispirillales bacterium]|nr:Fic family protein [Chitinispirillales bacterium]
MEKTISQKLKDILISAAWTQEELARNLGTTQKTVNLWINERSSPHFRHIQKIDLLYFDIIGYAQIEFSILSKQKNGAISKGINVAKIVSDKEILDALTLHLTYHTNTIEGSTMTLADVQEILSDDNKVLSNKTAREQIEAKNHRSALYFLLDQLNAKKDTFFWTKELILEIHLRLMNSIISNAGAFRNHGARIASSRVVLANYVKIPRLIEEFIESLNTPTKDLIRFLAQTHSTFEKIHPFSDGNGRTGRLILFISALQYGVIPPLVLKEKKHAYYKYLEIAQTEEKFELLEMFMAESIISAYELIKNRLITE